ncbi:TetR/AcrR family transcriptional regulator [Dethiosulfatarculus sandiegensis]|uniref:HTH tetR-type domain-containing protein n=1 Tax=Dethiosulfatarculus sandiegensis TaxID=1429043 RepID=A0A0D2JFB7_9BACT|nr:TetR/AcrR family transcriptional regulator [Dethiosulfatarculus sandiegensis]KIX14406.1 hypothetical protein X474_09645 [Dethiosulfatarculus sandiegensis]
MASSKEKILDAAEREFAELGIAGASLRGITKSAGVNLGSIYYYFESKEDLIMQVLQRRIDQFRRKGLIEFEEFKKKVKSPTNRDYWLMMVKAMLRFRSRHPQYVAFISNLFSTRKDVVEKALGKNEDFLQNEYLKEIKKSLPERVWLEAEKRVTTIMLMIHMLLLNKHMAGIYLEKKRVFKDQDDFAEEIANIASASMDALAKGC